jgi:hypothetical protein
VILGPFQSTGPAFTTSNRARQPGSVPEIRPASKQLAAPECSARARRRDGIEEPARAVAPGTKVCPERWAGSSDTARPPAVTLGRVPVAWGKVGTSGMTMLRFWGCGSNAASFRALTGPAQYQQVGLRAPNEGWQACGFQTLREFGGAVEGRGSAWSAAARWRFWDSDTLLGDLRTHLYLPSPFHARPCFAAHPRILPLRWPSSTPARGG